MSIVKMLVGLPRQVNQLMRENMLKLDGALLVLTALEKNCLETRAFRRVPIKFSRECSND